MADERRHTTHPVTWFLDLHNRGILDLTPPYQRRSVWTQSYKDYFIDTVLLNYPAPAVFIFEEIDDLGRAKYSVVDGKQRITTVLDFIRGDFPVSETASIERLRGEYFPNLASDVKRAFYSYLFSVEFLPSTDDQVLNNIFDRINRNVAKLTQQELRNARFYGRFAKAADTLAEFMTEELGYDFPRITVQSRRQMKDVELVVNLMLLTESGIDRYSQAQLDEAYNERDDEWDQEERVDAEFRKVVAILRDWKAELFTGPAARFRNQADFYSLFAIVLELLREGILPESFTAIARLHSFMTIVLNDEQRKANKDATRYWEATRSAPTDVKPRRDRGTIMRKAILGEIDAES